MLKKLFNQLSTGAALTLSALSRPHAMARHIIHDDYSQFDYQLFVLAGVPGIPQAIGGLIGLHTARMAPAAIGNWVTAALNSPIRLDDGRFDTINKIPSMLGAHLTGTSLIAGTAIGAYIGHHTGTPLQNAAIGAATGGLIVPATIGALGGTAVMLSYWACMGLYVTGLVPVTLSLPLRAGFALAGRLSAHKTPTYNQWLEGATNNGKQTISAPTTIAPTL